MRSRFIVIAFVVGLAGTACATAPRSLTDPSASPTPSQSSEPSESPSPSPSETAPEWKTFVEPLTGITFEYPRSFVVRDEGATGDSGHRRAYVFKDERFLGPASSDGIVELSVWDNDVSGISQWLSEHSASSDDQAEGDYFTNVSGRTDATLLGREAIEFDWVAVDGLEVHSMVVAHGRYVISLGWWSVVPDYRAEIGDVFESMRERARE